MVCFADEQCTMIFDDSKRFQFQQIKTLCLDSSDLKQFYKNCDDNKFELTFQKDTVIVVLSFDNFNSLFTVHRRTRSRKLKSFKELEWAQKIESAMMNIWFFLMYSTADKNVVLV
jgi:hypothetical protein